ncbi:hypothetical protein RI129_012214 [Pyrocoelia pectoralis]|uniref:Uncharacterized protein n=1 Tax=Pyrocoelia pectoralis TaxID=417401 RepID=A0AAN7V5Q4_9COLE
MPRKKRSRKRKTQKKQIEDDFQMRQHIEDTCIVSSISEKNLVSVQEHYYETPNISLNDSGLKYIFSSRNGCYSSSLIESNTEFQSCEAITQTPHINRVNLDSVRHISSTPLKQVEFSNNSAVCIQDLNNLQGKNVEEKVVRCSRTLDRLRLNHLREFNDIILNTSQGECFDDSTRLANDEDDRFFTPHRFQFSPPLSTPIFSSVGVQTSTPKRKVSLSFSKRHSYNKTSPTMRYYKQERRSLERISVGGSTREVCTVNTIETCAHIVSKLKKYHGRYSSQLPTKVFDLFTWLGVAIKQSLVSLYKFYTHRNTSHCENCNQYLGQIAALSSNIENLRSEMKDEIKQQLCKFEENIKRHLSDTRLAPIHTVPPPPPPPPPPPLLPSLTNSSKIVRKTEVKKSQDVVKPIISLDDILNVKLRKISGRPSIEVRRSTEPNLATSLKTLKPIKSSLTSSTSSLQLRTPPVNSESPCSTLTRMLTGVDANVRRVKRLQRSNTYNSFDDSSRRGLLTKRERDSRL